VLLGQAHDVLDGSPLVVLGAAGLEEIVRSHKPVENLLVAVAGTFKKTVFTEVISHGKCLKFEVSKNLL